MIEGEPTFITRENFRAYIPWIQAGLAGAKQGPHTEEGHERMFSGMYWADNGYQGCRIFIFTKPYYQTPDMQIPDQGRFHRDEVLAIRDVLVEAGVNVLSLWNGEGCSSVSFQSDIYTGRNPR